MPGSVVLSSKLLGDPTLATARCTACCSARDSFHVWVSLWQDGTDTERCGFADVHEGDWGGGGAQSGRLERLQLFNVCRKIWWRKLENDEEGGKREVEGERTI